MLVERGLQVMNVEVIGDAYAIASNYLRRSGAIPDVSLPTTGCSKSSSKCFIAANTTRSGSPTRRLRKFEAASSELPDRMKRQEDPWKPLSTASCRPTTCCEPLRRRQRRSARQGYGVCQQTVRGRRKGHASADRVRPDLSARTRRQHRSGEGGIYRAVRGGGASPHAIGRPGCCRESAHPVRCGPPFTVVSGNGRPASGLRARC